MIALILVMPKLQEYSFKKNSLGPYITNYSIPLILLGLLVNSTMHSFSESTFPHGKNQEIILNSIKLKKTFKPCLSKTK